jgi:hypothetical protein
MIPPDRGSGKGKMTEDGCRRAEVGKRSSEPPAVLRLLFFMVEKKAFRLISLGFARDDIIDDLGLMIVKEGTCHWLHAINAVQQASPGEFLDPHASFYRLSDHAAAVLGRLDHLKPRV